MAKKTKSRAIARKPLFSSPPLGYLSELSKSAAPSKPPTPSKDFSPISLQELTPRAPSPESFFIRPAKPQADAPLPPAALSAPEMAQLMARPKGGKRKTRPAQNSRRARPRASSPAKSSSKRPRPAHSKPKAGRRRP